MITTVKDQASENGLSPDEKCLQATINYINGKLIHYCAVVCPETLYASECLTMNRRDLTEELKTKKRKIVRKILSPVRETVNIEDDTTSNYTLPWKRSVVR